LLIALAPAARRQPPRFTGDGPGGSGVSDSRAAPRRLREHPTSRHPGVVWPCTTPSSPPLLRPARQQADARGDRELPRPLDAELAALPRPRIVVALGRIAFDAYLQLLKQRGAAIRPRPAFGHGIVHALPNGQTLIGCYHPSRQNTNTGKLTPRMMDHVFRITQRALSRL
jgi:uracil-DNA glycosylase